MYNFDKISTQPALIVS